MRRYARISCKALITFLLTALLLSGCSLLPVEEVYETKPLIKNYTPVQYNLAYVQRGDLQTVENLSCKYMSVATEMLSFPVGGCYYKGIYVRKGDIVAKGTLLAELDCTSIEQSIRSTEENIANLETRKRHIQEEQALAAEQQTRLLAAANADPEETRKSLDALAESYTQALNGCEDSLYIARLRLKELQYSLSQRQLYAGLDGIVTYVRAVQDGARNIEGETFISISDAVNHVFCGETKNYELLEIGSVVSLLCNKEELEATVISDEELGFEPSFTNKGAKKVYFRLNEPNASLDTGDRASLTLLLAESKDTLYVPVKAVHQVEDRTFVYSADENGLKIMRDVKIGISSTKFVEILEGLNEGDNVIV